MTQMPQTVDEAMALLAKLSPEEQAQLDDIMTWAPLPGPQLDAWNCKADELFYGGAAGGGKTDFVCGLALEEHQVSIVYRREATQLTGITDRLTELLGGKDQYHGGEKIWRFGGRQLEYGSMPNPGDEQKYQGRPHDLIIYDEVTQFTEFQYRYLQTWNRSVDPKQRCRVVATGNPPTTPEGLWVLKYWAPWLDDEHPLYGEVAPGELVYYIIEDGKDTIVEDGCPVKVTSASGKTRWVLPRSRTFIPASVEDNPFLMRTGYADQLEALPEPLRSQMRDGDFKAGQDDHEWQVIPSAWVDAAQRRWRLRENEPHGVMSAMGVDPARGGKDQMVLVPRHGSWFSKPIETPGAAVPDGPAGAALVVQHLRNGAPVMVDVVGVGTSVVDHLEGLGMDVTAIHGSAASHYTDKTGRLKMANLRSALYWRMRELLAPQNPDPIALPPGSEVKADLCAPHYRVTARGVQVEAKEDLMKLSRLGRSPDIGDAIVYAAHEYESRGNVSQAILHAEKDDHFDGPYVREVTLQDRRKSSWCGFNDTIDYGD